MKTHFVFAIGIAALALGTAIAPAATTFLGAPADELVFFSDPDGTGANDGPPASLLGLPDGGHRDIADGGATFRFSDTLQSFDYTPVEIPAGTDLILVDVGLSLDIPTVEFGYGTPADADLDGDADVVAGSAILISTAGPQVFSWGPPSESGVASLIFYDLDGAAGFAGFTSDFFVSVDALDNQEIDALHLAVPEPGSLFLATIGLIGVMGWRCRRSSQR
jgi:hypothetical protein